MESRSVTLSALAMMLALLLAAAAVPGQCQPSSLADPGSSYKGHKACDPMCFVKCVMSGGDINCFGTCILQCLFPTTGGEPDRTDPQAACMADCAVPACAKLCTKAEPFSKGTELCLESCGDHCADVKKQGSGTSP